MFHEHFVCVVSIKIVKMKGLLEVENNITISTDEVESAESFAILLFLIGLILSLIVAYVTL